MYFSFSLNMCTFLCPCIERSRAYSFWSVHLSVCLSVCKNFNIGHIFRMVSDRIVKITDDSCFTIGPFFFFKDFENMNILCLRAGDLTRLICPHSLVVIIMGQFWHLLNCALYLTKLQDWYSHVFHKTFKMPFVM
jgi:hypothetical protein